MPWPGQPNGRSPAFSTAQHVLLPGVPSGSGFPDPAAGQNHRPRLEVERRPGRKRSKTKIARPEICPRLESRIAASVLGVSSMKTIPPACPEPELGRKYWRSLDQLAETPEFRQWVEREFPAGASEWTDPVSRRHFVKIMSASFLLAGMGLAGSGCRRPVETIVPFG